MHVCHLLREFLCGEALRKAGPRGTGWLRDFGSQWKDDGQWLVDLVGDPEAPSKDVTTARRVTGAGVRLRLTDGRTVTRELGVPVGAVGSVGGPPVGELVREK